MSIPIINPTDGATLAAGRMTVRILEDGGLTGHRLGIVEITVPPQLAGPPQHVHREHDETFFVLAGTPSFTCGADTVTARLRSFWDIALSRSSRFLSSSSR